MLLLASLVACSEESRAASNNRNKVPLYGLFEVAVQNGKQYDNPFSGTELRSEFTSPSGKIVKFFGFYDGDQTWRQRFMPDEPGVWTYKLSFTDEMHGQKGSFECVTEGAKPGFWCPDPENSHWFRLANGERFFPVSVMADCHIFPQDWQDAIEWCVTKNFNTLVVSNFNATNWGTGWGNRTAWATKREEPHKEVDYERMNLEMWKMWDQMILSAGKAGIYIGSFQGPCGKYGGQERGKYPPIELAFFPGLRDRFDTELNKWQIRYFVARQGAFWNVAYWALGNTEVFAYCVADEQEFIEYGEYFASITPFGRMITAQDCEQEHRLDRRWLSKLRIPDSRKFNTVQTSIGDPNNPEWTKASLNNWLALDAWGKPQEFGGFPIMTTEGLWEAQGRATKPLTIIWGFMAAGAHTMWADWNYENDDHTWGSIGRSWVPVKEPGRRLFTADRLGVDCEGDEQLVIAVDHMKTYEYWKMWPHNELVSGSAEAYCLAEPGQQYMVYAPEGGTIRLDLSSVSGTLKANWFDPRKGTNYGDPFTIAGGGIKRLIAPGTEDWILNVRCIQ